MSITGIIPFFAGNDPVKRLAWLHDTIESMLPTCDEIVVGATDWAKAIPESRVVKCEAMNCEPHHLQTSLCRWAQRSIDADFIFFNESDQIIHANYMPGLFSHLWKDKNYVIAPHRCVRLNQTEPDDWAYFGHATEDGRNFWYRYERFLDGEYEYVVHNRPQALDFTGKLQGYHFIQQSELIDNELYTNPNNVFAYGAAYIAHRDTFRKVKFHDTITYPLEEAAGFAIHRTPGVKVLKMLNTQLFWADHLSHRMGEKASWS